MNLGFPPAATAIVALAFSLAVHALVAAFLAIALGLMPPAALPKLDLSSVEMSFAEEDAESAPAAAMPTPQEARRLEAPEVPAPAVEHEPVHAVAAPAISHEPPPEAVEEPAIPEVRAAASETAEPTEAPAPAPLQARVDAPPRPRRAIRPEYPAGCRRRGEEGEVVLKVRVSAAGVVDGVSVVSACAYPELVAAAVRAAKKASFAPARSGDTAVAAEALLPFVFKLTGLTGRNGF